jgi:Protein of unknown function (DUF998)
MPCVSRLASTARTLCGIIGPAAFTAAWAIGTRHQRDYSIAHEHISGLAAPDAVRPHVMRGGFYALGAASVLFAWELDRRLDTPSRTAGPGPALLGASGLATVLAGAATRDRMSNAPLLDGPPGQSAVNDLHDVAAVAGGVAAAAGLLALARRFRGDPAWNGLARQAATTALTGTALSGWFLSNVTRPGNGLVQRASVSLPLGFMARTAVRMLRSD